MNKPKKNRAEYRIQNADGTIMNAGTDLGSWFHLQEAREQVNREQGQRIIWDDGLHILGEVF